MASQRECIRRIARAVLAGPRNEEALLDRLDALRERGRRPRWLRQLCLRLALWLSVREGRVRVSEVGEFLRADPYFRRAWIKGQWNLKPVPVPKAMTPSPGAPESWEVPPILEIEQLSAVLQAHPRDLEWLAHSWNREHYLYRWYRKAHSGEGRLIEIPKPMLKRVQRHLLHQVLDRIPPHEAAHGFRTGHSVHSYVAEHTGKDVVLRMDLKDFFPSITGARVRSLFLTAGYPDTMAGYLTALVTNRTPHKVIMENPHASTSRADQSHQYLAAHLPQGSPTSPLLANLCAFHLDCRLARLAQTAGTAYTRYADDLLFSANGEFARRVEAFSTRVSAIILEEGFHNNFRKTRIMRSSQRQSAGGIVLNAHPNLCRQEFDTLKAILTNCQRTGPAEQNLDHHPDFRAHLQGRIAWATAIHSQRGAKLQRLFDQVDWSGS